MISSISQSGSTASIWQAYAASKMSQNAEGNGTDKANGMKPKGPPPNGGARPNGGPPPGGGSKGGVQSGDSSQALSDSQKDSIKSILEGYDSTSLTTEDAKSIVEAFQNAGIQSGTSLAETMEEYGFDAEEVGSLANVRSTSVNNMQIREMMMSSSKVNPSSIAQISSEDEDSQSAQQYLAILKQYQANQIYSFSSQDYSQSNLSMFV